MRISPTLHSIDNIKTEALVIFLPKACLPLRGFLSLLDWRMCFRLSNLLLNYEFIPNSDPLLMVDYKNLNFGRVFIFSCIEELSSKAKFDSKIVQVLKILNNAKISDFVLVFPEQHTWMFEHWLNNYENHSVFKNIDIIDQHYR